MFAFDDSILLYRTDEAYVGCVDDNIQNLNLDFYNFIKKYYSIRWSIKSIYVISQYGYLNKSHNPTILTSDNIQEVIGKKFRVFEWKVEHSEIYFVAENINIVKKYLNKYESNNEKGAITEIGKLICYGYNGNAFYTK